jgi:hypothetical protein
MQFCRKINSKKVKELKIGDGFERLLSVFNEKKGCSICGKLSQMRRTMYRWKELENH